MPHTCPAYAVHCCIPRLTSLVSQPRLSPDASAWVPLPIRQKRAPVRLCQSGHGPSVCPHFPNIIYCEKRVEAPCGRPVRRPYNAPKYRCTQPPRHPTANAQNRQCTQPPMHPTTNHQCTQPPRHPTANAHIR
eukprot:364027-Chlamydomonas_euryale.AAC.7